MSVISRVGVSVALACGCSVDVALPPLFDTKQPDCKMTKKLIAATILEPFPIPHNTPAALEMYALCVAC